MGYRHYFFKADKKDVEMVMGLSYQQLKEKYADNDYIDLDNVISHEEIYDFGKLHYEDTAEQIYNTGKPLFMDKECMECFSDYKPYEVGKDGLIKAIEIYAKKVENYYRDLLVDGVERIVPIFGFTIKDEDIKSNDKARDLISDKIRTWSHFDRYIKPREKSNNVTCSWEYEYSIFNLIHLLKTIDWESETLLFYGR